MNSGFQEKYEKIAKMTADDFKREIQLSEEGLSSKEVEERTKQYGTNIIEMKKPKPWYRYLFASFIGPFNLIMVGIAIMLTFTDVVFAKVPTYINIIVILSISFISVMLEFVSEYRSNKAAEKLKKMIFSSTTVIRNGKTKRINSEHVTVGDTVLLSAGDMIPADLRIIENKDLYVGQSSLTGESEPVEKFTELNKTEDLDNICFMGTNVISGYAKGVVLFTGDETYFGKIASKTAVAKPKTSFEAGTENLTKLLIKFIFAMIPIVFLVSFVKHGIFDALLFSVAIAIGITPILLPVILSATLAAGATKMSKKKTIIKKLDSIQSFGDMDILCTDKTGTLTEDRIVLEKYLNAKGEEDRRILKHVYLNSYFQTGLRNNIDNAIIKSGMEDMIKGYIKVDEVPYDFKRRRLSVIVKDENEKRQLITKGAIEEMLDICTYYDYKAEASELTKEMKENILHISEELNKEGLRVLGVAQKNRIEGETEFTVEDEKDMVFLGFIGFLDPPKKSAKHAIETLNKNGVRVVILTGDNDVISRAICEKVDITSEKIVLGSEIEGLTDKQLTKICKDTNVFAKLSPMQKSRVVELFRKNGYTVGYMGDGINDSPALIQSDVGISVDSAVDIAKETADIILLQKDLLVLNDGVLEGRKTFGNLLKYIKMAASFNFAEMTSVIIASILLPFLPITPMQLLVQSLLYDMGQVSLPFDNVDDEYVAEPKKWNIKSVKRFMLFMGPLSTAFDLMVFSLLWFVFGLRQNEAALFQSVWFSYGVVSNLVGLHVIRTAKVPIKESNASISVYATSIIISIVACVVPFTALGRIIGLAPIPFKYFAIIIGLPFVYDIVAQFMKKIYIKKYKEWV